MKDQSLPLQAAYRQSFRKTQARVALQRLTENFTHLQRLAQDAQVWPVVKANAYGHGDIEVARALQQAGADGLCVALVEEGLSLRRAGVSLPLLILGALTDSQSYRTCQDHRLTPVLHCLEHVALAEAAIGNSSKEKLQVHVKLDTGMARLGSSFESWPKFGESLAKSQNLEVVGIMSHLANADAESLEATRAQKKLFIEGLAVFAQAGIRPELVHLANSAALLRAPDTHFTMVRPGLCLYGASPFEGDQAQRGVEALQPVLSLTTHIVSLRRLEVGQSAGYGSRFVARRPSLIATLPMGYADGLPRALWREGRVLVHGQEAPFAGVISMDMAMIDLTDLPAAQVGDEVILLGQAEAGSTSAAPVCIRVEDWARWADTIAWEVMTRLSERVPRYYT